MNYEEKYKQSLERARGYYLTGKGEPVDFIKMIFPELAESEDERMKREILELVSISGIDYNQYEEIKDWLEKQGKQTHVELGHSEVTKASNQEPKFSVGDWITDGYVGGQITSIEENYPCYKIVDFMGINTSIPFTIQDNYHLWTIKDAKEGDVLTYVTDEEDLWIMIYWSLYEPYEGHVHYHALLVNNDFSDKGTCCICVGNLKPATKEQRELLFRKMRESGYEWNAEKKELKTIESKKLDADEVIAWLVANICDFEYYVKWFKKDFGL